MNIIAQLFKQILAVMKFQAIKTQIFAAAKLNEFTVST